MRGILAIIGMLMTAVGLFFLLSDLISMQTGCGAALLIVGIGLYIDSLTGANNIKESK